MQKRFENKCIIITGCSKGLGAFMAEDFAKEGANIIMCARSEEGLQKTQAKVQAAGRTADYVVGSAANPETWDSMIQIAKEKYGKIDILINNAGAFFGWSVDQMTLEDWNNCMENDATATFLGMNKVINEMKETDGGVILNISSLTAKYHIMNITSAGYASSKAAVNALTANAAYSSAKYNIRINALCPGSINTGMGAGVADEEAVKIRNATIPLYPHIMEMADVSNIAKFMVSEESRVITGVCLVADCGRSCLG